MKKKIYWKDIWLTIRQSKGRFFSIFSLMMIGAMALVGLKVTTPNMERTAQLFVDKTQMLDLAVMADYGLDEADVQELKDLPQAQVEFAYLTDVTIKDTYQAVRIFSQTDKISQYELVSGHLPQKESEIALATSLQKDYKIGDTISFTLGQDSPLKAETFTITGFVHSSEIWDQTSIGQTTVGTGELTAYAVTSPQAFDSEVYMLARIRYTDLAEEPYYSAAYEKKISQHQQDLETLLADNGQQRLEVLKASAQEAIQDGQAEIAQSEQDLTEAEQKIKDGESQLTQGQDQLQAAKSQIASGQASLAQSWQELSAAKAQLDATYQSLTSAKAQLDSSKAQLDASKPQLDAAAQELATAKAQLEAKNQELNQAAAQISEGQYQLQLAKEALEGQINQLLFEGKDPYSLPEIQEAQAKIQAQEASLAQAIQAYEAGFAQYQTGFAQYQAQESFYQASLQEYEAGLAQYQSGLAQYEAGYAQYQSGLAAYQAGLARYQAGQSQLDNSTSSLSQEESKLAQAQEELDAATQTYEQEAGTAQSQIQAAKEDLAQAQTELDGMEAPAYRVYSRSTLPGSVGYENYRESTSSISSIGNIFPLVLYLVAALVTFTTMTRFVDEERHQLGILGALGYSKSQIVTKFVIYGLVASLAGTLVGILLGNVFLSPMIGNIIAKSTVIGQSNLYFYSSWTLLALGLALLSAVLPTYLVARKELTNEPARLLQGKPPVAGSRILLEYLPLIWKRLTFTQKVTARNIFRYKLRMFMTIFGVAGSVALLFAGLGIQSSVSGIAERQFGDLLSYDILLVQKEDASSEQVAEVTEVLESDKVQKAVQLQSSRLTEEPAGLDETISINLMVSEPEELAGFVHLQERGGDKIDLTDQGAVLTENLANLYGVKAGDAVTLHIQDQTVTVQVAAIAEMYTGHFIYLTPAYYEEVTGQATQKDAYFITSKEQTPVKIKELAAQLLALKGVEGLVQNTSLIAMIEQVADSLQSVMIILTVLSVLLAMVILFNLTTINVAERVRELSTIRVLGFHNKEVTLYIYRETIILAMIGIVLGLGAGYALHRYILSFLGSSTTMFNPSVPLQGYLIPVISVLAILAVLGVLVNHRLRHLDMLEALKSGE
ncbi:FtsX-like permease family protein [Streptococcus sp.]|uniref:FtsX-like permease family protein n=1 Tax=Streptococcus sp. TaxID=1306 RepID=UPI0035A19AFE